MSAAVAAPPVVEAASDTARLSAACLRWGREPLPAEVAHASRRALLDGLACMIAGASAPELAPLRRYAATLGAGATPLPGLACSLGAPAAALVNGAHVHALELDDTHALSSVHAGGPVLGSAIAALATLAERDGRVVSGAELLGALAAGYEAACRPGAAARGRDPYARGFHPTGVYGAFGAAAAAGTLLGLDAERLAQALGIAGSMAAGSMAYLQNGAWTKRAHAGWAALAGFSAARLAAEGMRGPDRIFDGLYDALDAHSPRVDRALLLDALGERAEIARISVKPWACCRSIHAPITATLAAMRSGGLAPGDVASVELTICDEDLALIAEPRARKRAPADPTEAQFSLYWGVAAAVRHGDAGLAQFTPAALADPATRALALAVDYRADAELTRLRPGLFPARAVVRDRDGGRHEAAVDAPLGDCANPLTDAQLEDKARALLASARPADGAPLAEAALAVADAPDALHALARLAGGPEGSR